jgi:signal peptidase I
MADRDPADSFSTPRHRAVPWDSRPRAGGIPRDEVFHERFSRAPGEPAEPAAPPAFPPERPGDTVPIRMRLRRLQPPPVPAPESVSEPPPAAEAPLNGSLAEPVTDTIELRPPKGEPVFIDAWDAAERAAAPVIAARKRRSTLLLTRELVETLILALAIFIAVRAVVQNFRVEGSSMDPTYATGQYVLVNKALYARVDLEALSRFLPFIDTDGGDRYLFRGPRRGEVIVFHPPLEHSYDRDFIKRVIGLPGDHVQVKDGRVYVNDRELVEPYLRNAQTFCGGQWCDVRLGPDEYFVMGDNRTNSSDSRLWGPVPAANVIGKAWMVYLPLQDFGPAPNQAPILGTPVAAGAAIPVRP